MADERVLTDSDDEAPPLVLPPVQVDLSVYSDEELQEIRRKVAKADKAEKECKDLLSDVRATIISTEALLGSTDRSLQGLTQAAHAAARVRKVTSKERDTINSKKKLVSDYKEKLEGYSTTKREVRLQIRSIRSHSHEARTILAALNAVADGAQLEGAAAAGEELEGAPAAGEGLEGAPAAGEGLEGAPAAGEGLEGAAPAAGEGLEGAAPTAGEELEGAAH